MPAIAIFLLAHHLAGPPLSQASQLPHLAETGLATQFKAESAAFPTHTAAAPTQTHDQSDQPAHPSPPTTRRTPPPAADTTAPTAPPQGCHCCP
ncbi:hypothetical protein NYY91_18615 [Acinetobacter baumannii]|nr:hypothetical protein [Acinetobacter baumannii]